ncbi:N-acetylmuramoyl-L-alanine amidase CwlD [Paenibacillus sp. MBLB4367]|uniref:N-acetylmuramoyl-L-alanine amidase CwlD n=1 Tax=Paenibacillus sp. MBLB4367 TaxID=3384767 RepID=UPI0039082A44
MRKFPRHIVVWMNYHGVLKMVSTAVLVLMIGFIFSYELPSTKTWTYWTMPLSGKVIALDAGHGGPDGGAESSPKGIIEKDVNLAISLYLRDYLQQAGALVVMTREQDNDLASPDTKGLSRRKTEDLQKRVEFIRKQKSDLMISIHLNSYPSSKWSGAQTFFYPSHKDNFTLANLIQNELKHNLENTDRVSKQVDTVFLLKSLQIPAALVEVGFLSNPEESRLMAQEGYQKKVAASIYQGILRYYSGEKSEGKSDAVGSGQKG